MRIREQVLSVIEQLKGAINDSEAESIVSVSAGNIENKKSYFKELITLIENISPLDCNSLQWRNFRIARIIARKLAMQDEIPACY